MLWRPLPEPLAAAVLAFPGVVDAPAPLGFAAELPLAGVAEGQPPADGSSLAGVEGAVLAGVVVAGFAATDVPPPFSYCARPIS